MKNIKTMRFSALLLLLLFNFSITDAVADFTLLTDLSIGRGRIEDNMTISIMGYYPTGKGPMLPFNKPIVIKPNTFFDLNALRLNDNKPLKEDKVIRKGYKGLKIESYEIKMETEGEKPFYGRIAFFRAKNKAAQDAVTSYYKISFTDKFAEASEGRMAYYYERYHIGSKGFVTWVIWGSDAPLR